jgi:hypothetical protein
VRIAAHQAPLLPGGSMAALEMIQQRVRRREAEGVDVPLEDLLVAELEV